MEPCVGIQTPTLVPLPIYGKGLGVRLPAFGTYAGHSSRGAASERVGHPVMRSQPAFRNVFPPFARRQLIAALRMQRIVDSILALRGLSAHKQQDIVLAVVQEAMADTGPSREGRKVARAHRVKNAVDPGVNLTLQNVHELLFFLLGMRPRTSLSRRQPHQVHADLQQSRNFADASLMAGAFVAVGIFVASLRT
jgi:hypothetical protein